MGYNYILIYSFIASMMMLNNLMGVYLECDIYYNQTPVEEMIETNIMTNDLGRRFYQGYLNYSECVNNSITLKTDSEAGR